MSELKNYIGVRLIKACFAYRSTVRGYEVTYLNPDGTSYREWLPEKMFESAGYLPIEYDDHITDADIQAFLDKAEIVTEKRGDKTTLVEVTLPTGFVDLATSSCVSPENYDEAIGKQCALAQVKERLWKHFGFLLQWAKGARP